VLIDWTGGSERRKKAVREFSVVLAGAGAIGRAHAATLDAMDDFTLAGIADPTEAGRQYAGERGVPWFDGISPLLASLRPDAVIVATPNQTHMPIAVKVLEAGIPALVEKPVASAVEEGLAIAEASERTGVPVLVGHHRRHNPIIRRAREILAAGELGKVTNVTILSAFFKPDDYFAAEWRRKPGGGPILINLIHEIDLVRHLCGEIRTVHAVSSSRVRGSAVEDSAAVLLHLENGALATISLSDTAVAPWAWDLSAGESGNYPPQPQPLNSHFISGTKASLTLPQLELWRYGGRKSWFEPIAMEELEVRRSNPYASQLLHLREVAMGKALPLVGAGDATRTLQATLAVSEAATTGRPVSLH
jgi:predicted dehydrogenase